MLREFDYEYIQNLKSWSYLIGFGYAEQHVCFGLPWEDIIHTMPNEERDDFMRWKEKHAPFDDNPIALACWRSLQDVPPAEGICFAVAAVQVLYAISEFHEILIMGSGIPHARRGHEEETLFRLEGASCVKE
ncbi:MAG: hypothetical protein LBD60_02255 [Puniceicoccales bacterium]|jgi:hypothetical protein|nr:hypothetical protein [Puniceicoccales bacterium]